MAQILVSDLMFCYDGSFDNIFEHASFSVDTDWKLGFLGRNGKGKSTFLALLQGKYEYQGVISAGTAFDYFPYQIPDFGMEECASELLDEMKPGCEEWRVLREIDSLKKAADRTRRWAEKNENTKIGFDPVKEPDRGKNTRAFIGAKTKKAQARVLAYEKRIDREIEEKEGLLQDIENPAALKLYPLIYHKERLLYAKNLELSYEGRDKPVLSGFSFELRQGERVLLQGVNGSGKSTLIHAILDCGAGIMKQGELMRGAGLVVSYVNQDTSFLRGGLRDFCRERRLDESLFCALLRQLDMERAQFSKNMEEFSEGQKKKVLIVASLLTPAHLYIWDEPLNYIDVFSRMQIEEMILRYEPTMLLVEHDVRFGERVATRTLRL